MRGYFGLGQLSATEKQDILNQHKSLYNGYQTMQPEVPNRQPLYVFDPAGDKDGVVVNNKGEVKKYTNFGINEQVEEKSMCEQCGTEMSEGICEQCDTEEMGEGVGKLDDIYDEEDLDPTGGFDYIEGPSNDVDTFEGMNKKLYKEDEYEDPDNEDDGFEDLQVGDSEMYEQGGNADDMDDDEVEPAYDFESGGPMAGGDVYPVNEYDHMESAWEDEIDEVDVSGSQGIYGEMDPPYDFDSEGPGKAGPYQRFSYNEEDEEDEFMDYDGDDASTWTGANYDDESEDDEWGEIDTDLIEGFKSQKTKILEMFNRFNNYN
jgi:hypothetical protein